MAQLGNVSAGVFTAAKKSFSAKTAAEVIIQAGVGAKWKASVARKKKITRRC